MGISNDAQREVDEFGAASAELKMFPWDSGYIRWEADSRYALEERIGSLEQEVYGLRKRNAELEAERRWIPVSERLPELNQDVLGLVDDEMLVGSFYQDLEHGIYFSDGGSCMLVATHWMPLPELPEVER